MENIRTYESFRLLRGKTREKELVTLAEARKDFDFRRLYIEEREKDLHVTFCRKFISEYVSWGILIISFLFLTHPIIFYMTLGIGITLKVYSNYCKKKFKKLFFNYKNSLMIVDSVIENDYGIKMPKQI